MILDTSEVEDELIYSDVHEDLLSMNPWGDSKNGEFIGRIVFSDHLSTDVNVPVYEFNVSTLIDDFIDGYEHGKGGPIKTDRTSEYYSDDIDGERKALEIIESLKKMIARLEERLI